MKSYLFELNAHLVVKIQSTKDSFATQFFTILSLVGNDVLIGGVLVILLFCSANKIQSLKIILFTALCASIMSIIKLIYSDPRPYFIFEQVKALACDQELGNPSGHAFVATVVLFLVVQSFLQEKFSQVKQGVLNLQQDENIIYLPHETLKYSLFNLRNYQTIFFYLFILLVGISRIYLGVHAINQVLLGWMYATYFIYIYYEYLDEFLEEKLTTIIYKNFNDKSHYWRFFSVYFGFYILAVLIGVFAFKIVDNNISRDELEKWETAVQIKNCEVKIAKFAHYKCFLDNQATAIIFGFFFSLQITKGDYLPDKFSVSWQQLRISKKILRHILLAFTVAAPLYLLGLVVKFDKDDSSQFVSLFFFKQLETIFLTILIFKLYPFLLYLTKLDIEGDLLNYQQGESFFDIGFKKTDLIRNEYL